MDAFMARPGIRIGVIDAETAQRYAEIVNHLKSAGRPIPTNDIWIAAHAMQHGLQILTFDRHFDHIPQVSKLSIDP
ncbi:MAG: PIN domain-containing protein [Nitrospira sp.]